MPLREVFRLIREKYLDEPAPGAKASDKELVEFFQGIIPEYDKDRFYISHMRKLVGWYNILLERGITDFSEPVEESDDNSPGSSGENEGDKEVQ